MTLSCRNRTTLAVAASQARLLRASTSQRLENEPVLVLRRGLRLTDARVDLDVGFLRIHDTKFSKSRCVPVAADADPGDLLPLTFFQCVT